MADDTVHCALKSVQAQCPDIKKLGKDVTWSFDLMVIRVTKDKIQQLKAIVSDYGFSPPVPTYSNENTPKYWTWAVDEDGNRILDSDGNPIRIGDSFGQIDMKTSIPATEPDGTVNYREDGY